VRCCVDVRNGSRDVGAVVHCWILKNKKAQARVHLGQSRLRWENGYLREVSSKDANRPPLVVIRRAEVHSIATVEFMSQKYMSLLGPYRKAINVSSGSRRPGAMA